MSVEMTAPRSRRAVLAAAAAAAAATVVTAIDRPAVVLAGSDGDVVLGASNTTGTQTAIAYTGSVSTSSGLKGYAASTIGDVRGVWGETDSTSGIGVLGHAASISGSTAGVWGTADSTLGIGVVGLAASTSGSTVGVSGRAASTQGVGVFGRATSVSGATVGVMGRVDSPSGTGVLATAATGTALAVAGKAKFSRSGRATVLKGRSYGDITVAGGLTSRSVVHATLQTYRTGVAVAAVRLNYPSAGKARIYLTRVASTTSSTYVGWLVAEY